MKQLRNIAALVLCMSGLLLTASAHADIFRCSNAEGKTLYTSFPCPDGMRTINAMPAPQSCGTDDCNQRRERELADARERARMEREQLAALTAERHRRGIEDQRLAEMRYEAELRNEAASQAAEEAPYPVYAVGGYALRCSGPRCLNNAGHRGGHVTGHGPRHDSPRIRAVGANPQNHPAVTNVNRPASSAAPLRHAAINR